MADTAPPDSAKTPYVLSSWPQQDLAMDMRVWASAPKHFIQAVSIDGRDDEVALTFSLVVDGIIDGKDRPVAIPQTTCFVTISHFMRIANLFNVYARQFQQRMQAVIEAEKLNEATESNIDDE